MFSSFAEQSATGAELIRTGADPADMPEVEYAFYKGSIFTVHGPMDGRRGARKDVVGDGAASRSWVEECKGDVRAWPANALAVKAEPIQTAGAGILFEKRVDDELSRLL